jgi:hypothetical protein
LASVEPSSRVHTDGWEGYGHLAALGYRHRVTVMRRSPKRPRELMPRVHRVVSLLKRWILGTHQGGDQQRASGVLPRRAYLSIQPQDLTLSRQAVLPTPTASHADRTGAVFRAVEGHPTRAQGEAPAT